MVESIWTNSVRNFILSSKDNRTNDELVQEINKRFKLKISKSLLRGFMSRSDIKRKQKVFVPRTYSEEARNFIIKNKEQMSNVQLAEVLKEKFGVETDNLKIKSYLINNNLQRTNRKYNFIHKPKKKTVVHISEKIQKEKKHIVEKICPAREKKNPIINELEKKLVRLNIELSELESQREKTKFAEPFEKLTLKIYQLEKEMNRVENEIGRKSNGSH